MAYEPVYQFKDITIRYTAPGGGTLQFETDMPGGVLAVRRLITLPATGATDPVRKTFPLDAVERSEGRIYRVTITPPANNILKLFDGQMSVKRIGVYLDGSLGNFWETDPLSVGG